MSSRKLNWSSVNNCQLQAFVPQNPSIMNSFPVSSAASHLEIYSSSSCHKIKEGRLHEKRKVIAVLTCAGGQSEVKATVRDATMH